MFCLAASVALACWVFTGVAHAAPSEVDGESRLAVGFQVDLFPTVVSAVNGELGYAPQLWFGMDHLRLRLIFAQLEPPDALAFADEGSQDPTTTVFTATIDYTFGDPAIADEQI